MALAWEWAKILKKNSNHDLMTSKLLKKNSNHVLMSSPSLPDDHAKFELADGTKLFIKGTEDANVSPTFFLYDNIFAHHL